MSKRKQAPETNADDSLSKRTAVAAFVPLMDKAMARIQGLSETPSFVECWETVGELLLIWPTTGHWWCLTSSLVGNSEIDELESMLFRLAEVVVKFREFSTLQLEVLMPQLIRIVDAARATTWKENNISEQYDGLKELGEFLASLKLENRVDGKCIEVAKERADICAEVAMLFGKERQRVEMILHLYCSAA